MTWLTTITCLSGSYSYGHQKVCFLHLLLLVFMETWLCEKEIDIFCHVKCCDFVYKNYFEGTWFHQKKKKKMWRADPREKTKAAKFYHVILE